MNKCGKCGGAAKLYTERNPYEPTGCYVSKVCCTKCSNSTPEYGVVDRESKYAIGVWDQLNAVKEG